MKLDTLNDLLIHELQDIRSAEEQLIEALPKMVKAAHSEDLKECFRTHLEETRGQLKRLDELMKQMEIGASKVKCVAMAGIVKEGAEIIAQDGDPLVKDCALIGAGRRVEHYEIASYSGAIYLAERIELDECVSVLESIVDEESTANERLSELGQELNAAAVEREITAVPTEAKRARAK
jgi:ferritin-like metal-binding protein YciE